MAVATDPVLSREEWERLRRSQDFDAIVPDREGSDWGGLLLRPDKVSFETQNADEQIYILMRRHWVTNVGWIFNAALYATLPFIIALVLTVLSINLFGVLGIRLTTLIGAAYYSVLLTYTVKHIVDWYFNMFIVTNERVLDYDFVTFTSRQVVESALENIGDVKEKSIGFLADFFNFGNVEVFSDAERNIIIFNSIPKPTLVRDKVSDLAKLARHHNERHR